jgi:group II intron reverse transcriptase/maturase
MEQILHKDNLNKAYKKVKSNKGAGGVDGMSVDELLGFLKNNKEQLIQQIKCGKYKPNPVRRVEIPKETKGEFRKLGVPTVVDRVFQQAITQVLSPIYEKQFSENSFGFRPRRGAHDALKQCQTNVNDGYVYVVDMDLEKFFDTVCQSKLIEVLSRTIKDGRVISLIHKYLNAGVIRKGMFEKTEVGMPQGGPLSPLLSNVMLNELDKELARRGHRFVRYADDCMIFCKSKKSAERTLKSIVPYIEEKLFLKVNRTKTCVAHISKVKYLGYSFYRYKGKCRLRVHPKSVRKMKDKIRKLTNRSNGWGNEYRAIKLKQFIRGWVNYFRMADMKSLLRSNDEWLRHRIRAIYWKQWKKVKTRFRELKKLGVEEEKAWICANMRNGNWYCSGYFVLQTAFNNNKLHELGYPTFTEFYLKICEN